NLASPAIDAALTAQGRATERAPAFARLPLSDKAALLRQVIAQAAAAAPEIVTIVCRGAGIDPTSARAGGAWLAGPVALLAGARSLAASLDDLSESGRPLLPLAHLRGRLDDQ